ncbi:MAG: DUF5659 domain-containing protein [Patescibacteria group bacterium]
METLKKNQYYSTTNLSLATLLSLFYPLWTIDKSNPQKSEFLFKRESGIDDLIESFWRRELKIEPLTYFNQLKLIKSRLYEEG